jgi:urea transporter
MVEEVILVQVFLGIVGLPPLTVIPRVLHTHLHLHVALNDKIEKHGNLPKSKALSKNREQCIEERSHIFHILQTLISGVTIIYFRTPTYY